MIEIEKFNYHLPKELIANQPASPRSASRLLVYNCQKNSLENFNFFELGNFLQQGDLLVLNNSKVIPARLFGKKTSGGKIEILLLEEKNGLWEVMIGGKIRLSEKIFFSQSLQAEVVKKDGKNGVLKFNLSGNVFWQIVNKIGKTPIPPYIKNLELSERELKSKYQTVFAENFGSVAAPTAGLHFTSELIGKLKSSGIQFATVDLHVGLGTFFPIDENEVKAKKLHSEVYSIPLETTKKILTTKKSGGRIFAVGTTVARSLESVSSEISSEKSFSGKTDIFIQPGDKFRVVDSLITNFHLPKSSLMMLVAAFIESKTNFDGREKLLEIYKYAINEKYRFYSFGDVMLLI